MIFDPLRLVTDSGKGGLDILKFLPVRQIRGVITRKVPNRRNPAKCVKNYGWGTFFGLIEVTLRVWDRGTPPGTQPEGRTLFNKDLTRI